MSAVQLNVAEGINHLFHMIRKPLWLIYYRVLLPWNLTRVTLAAQAFTLRRLSTHKDIHPRLTLFEANELNGEGTGQTGWNHGSTGNSPDSWKREVDSSKVSEQPGNQGQEEQRTGWLHNTVSPSEQNQELADKSTAQSLLQKAMKGDARNHRIISPPAVHSVDTHRVVVTEHKISVPLDYDGSNQERIDVYFTIVEKVNDEQPWTALADLPPTKRAQAYVANARMENADSMVLYLQGGPGFGAPTPIVSLSLAANGSWGAKALESYSRLVLMDQRGTGRSSPLSRQTLEMHFPGLLDENDDKTTQEVAEYLTLFRADSIVQDAEEIRDSLLLPYDKVDDMTGRPWGCALGQSFGGFCMLSYLSLVKDAPRICLLTGGIAPILTSTDEVYRCLWMRVRERSLQYYSMYPGDVAQVKKIVRLLLDSPVSLPGGGTLTARRFLQIGISLGGSPSAFASLHDLISCAFVDAPNGQEAVSMTFLKALESMQAFDNHPIYFWLHESIYADGTKHPPTEWTAHRQYEKLCNEREEFDFHKTCVSETMPVLFFGEMVFPWMAEDFAGLNSPSLRKVAEAIAVKSDWKPLYDLQRMKAALSSGQSRAAAAVYFDDMYVDFNACHDAFKVGGPLDKCKVWITNEYQHSGLRDAGSSVFEKLHGMAKGNVRTPS